MVAPSTDTGASSSSRRQIQPARSAMPGASLNTRATSSMAPQLRSGSSGYHRRQLDPRTRQMHAEIDALSQTQAESQPQQSQSQAGSAGARGASLQSQSRLDADDAAPKSISEIVTLARDGRWAGVAGTVRSTSSTSGLSATQASLDPRASQEDGCLKAAERVQAILIANGLVPSYPSPAAVEFASSSSSTSTDLLSLQVTRLNQLSQSHLDLSPPDRTSASFYSFLALALDPKSIRARRTLAMCYLAGSTPFPLTSPPLGDVLSAHATLHLLTDGPSTIFEDAECARLYAKACSRLSKFEEAETALRWTASRTDKSSTFSSGKVHPRAGANSPTSSSVDLSKGVLEPHRVVPGLTREKVRAQAHDEAELAALACKSGKSQDAEIGYAAAGVDPWNWRAWIGRCGLASDPSAEYAFPGALAHHSPAVFFAAVFLERLSAAGLEATAEGCLSWVGGRSANAEQVGRAGSMSKANAAVAKESNVVEAAAAAPTRAGSHTSAPQVRPGSRHPSQTAGSAVTAGVKRVRAAGTVAAPSSANATRSQSTTRSGAAATTRPGVRQGLSVGRQNEPPTRPASSMSGSSILTSSANAADEKPASSHIVIGGSQSQRVTRSALAPTSGAAQTRSRAVNSQGGRSAATRNTPSSASQTTPAPQGAAKTNSIAGRTAAPTGTQAPRRAMRAGAPSSATSSESEAGPGHRKAGLTAGRSNSSGQHKERNTALGEESAAIDRALREVLRASCEEAARLACIWSAVDGAVLDVVRTMAEAYGALSRNVGRKASWVLRPSEEMFGETSSGSKARSLGFSEGWKDRGDHRRGSLPASVRDAPATRCLLGIAAYQTADYATSERHFAYARAKDPSMVQHMDIFSTVLFYLKREVALSALVCHLMLLDSSHPIAQIAAGNAYSMQGEHSIALRCFRRAALASPAHPYAYTLAAHEAKSLNLLERAIALYRAAIRADQRFWNAWAGLAEVYMANESFDLAEYHWGMALRLNTGNAVLWDVYGRCQEALSNPVEARTAYERAISLDPKLPSTRLRLAQLHAFFGDTEKAHEQLLLTCQLAPDEPSVHLELARSYMKLGGGEFSTASASRKKTQLERKKRGWSAWSDAQGKKVLRTALPEKMQELVAHHLCAAIDLDPRSLREIKSMGEGATSALRGAAWQSRTSMGVEEEEEEDEMHVDEDESVNEEEQEEQEQDELEEEAIGYADADADADADLDESGAAAASSSSENQDASTSRQARHPLHAGDGESLDADDLRAVQEALDDDEMYAAEESSERDELEVGQELFRGGAAAAQTSQSQDMDVSS